MGFSMYGAPLDNWAKGSSVDVFSKHGEYGFSSMGSWCYSREWVWNLRTRFCCIASGK